MSRFLETYGKDGELHLMSQLKQPDVSSDTIDKALRHGSVDVRREAAGHKNATKEQLDIASNDDHPYVRYEAASHKNATKKQLDKALNNKQLRYLDASVAAASNPNLTKEQLDKALNHKKWWYVRTAAASNPNATKEQLDIASNDPHIRVSKAAKKNLESRK